MKGYLIAETNEHGDIEWVWVQRPKDRTPKPFKGLRDKLVDVNDFKAHGAQMRDIQNWIKRAPF